MRRDPVGMNAHAYPSGTRRRIRCGPRGVVHFITTVTEDRIRHFDDPAVAAAVCAAIRSPACWPGASIVAWVLMPDHWHGLIRLDGDTSLAGCVATFQACTARAAREADGRFEALWSAAFHDKVLRGDAELLGMARYLMGNPVRAGLAANVGAYPY